MPPSTASGSTTCIAYIYRTHDGGETWQKITNGLPDDAAVNTVREDPERKGLLFAGTETSIWVSFDDGDHWQSLQLNLPHTSMRDLVVHGDDIVVGTHGRSFWILDDITPLAADVGRDCAARRRTCFSPQVAYRVRRSTNTDTPLPPEEPAGQNPPDGRHHQLLARRRTAARLCWKSLIPPANWCGAMPAPTSRRRSIPKS